MGALQEELLGNRAIFIFVQTFLVTFCVNDKKKQQNN